ncbi:ferrochelatase [Paenibacillus sp. UNC217MF]|uniref:ferrochelatase n=1 Tax=Paenibacillus sp. UNC217MF TaxID=1449062 RepID=UPI00068FEA21|nr:ferrochelatase [Paenibacillus sp. UNC217MF]
MSEFLAKNGHSQPKRLPLEISMDTPRRAILLASYSACASIDDVPAMYHHILRGHGSPSEAIVQGVIRYSDTGTCDPLYTVTKRQSEAITQLVEAKFGEVIPVYIGCKHSHPFVADAIQQAIRDGITELAVLHATPFFTASGTGSYVQDAKKAIAAANSDMKLTVISEWQAHPDFIQLMARRLHDAYVWMPSSMLPTTRVIFTVHSKPGLPSAHGDFIASYKHVAGLIAEQANIGKWDISYRSGMPAPQRWLGPDINEVILGAASDKEEAVVICELTSLTENVEVYHDIGQEAKQTAEQCGMQFVCTEYPNDAYDFMDFLSNIAAAHFELKAAHS